MNVLGLITNLLVISNCPIQTNVSYIIYNLTKHTELEDKKIVI